MNGVVFGWGREDKNTKNWQGGTMIFSLKNSVIHSLVRPFVRYQHSCVCLLRTSSFAHALHYAHHSLMRSAALPHSLPSSKVRVKFNILYSERYCTAQCRLTRWRSNHGEIVNNSAMTREGSDALKPSSIEHVDSTVAAVKPNAK